MGAYAFVNHYMSFYNSEWCRSVSAQMHEVGHNLGLGHSGKGSNDYGDRTGIMGYSYFSDDGPKMCFNPAKTYQLGWYNDQLASLDPSTIGSGSRTFTLNGVADYQSNKNAVVSLRLIVDGNADYYVGYNKATGAHSGTQDSPNRITVIKKESGGPVKYGESKIVAALTSNGSTKISNWNGKNGVDVTIKVDGSVGGNIRDAKVIISVGNPNNNNNNNSGEGPAPTPQSNPTKPPTKKPTNKPTPKPPTKPPTKKPTASPPTGSNNNNNSNNNNDSGCNGKLFQLVLVTDLYAGQDQTSWTLTDKSSGEILVSGGPYRPWRRYVEPSQYTGYCLTGGREYEFRIEDGYGDGLCCDWGNGGYRGYLYGKEINGLFGGKFGKEDVKTFTVPVDGGSNNSPSNKNSVIGDNDNVGSECVDDTTFQFAAVYTGNVTRGCNWVGDHWSKKKVKKRCKKILPGTESKLYDVCKETCGKVGKGECSHLQAQHAENFNIT